MVSVIISYWAGRSPRNLYHLLDQIYRYDAAYPFSVTVVCNGRKDQNFKLPKKYAKREIKLLNRINSGYNIGAWNHGWKHDSNSQYFLFLQDECRIIKDGWLRAFVEKMQTSPDIGLLGESINWKCSWESQRNNPIAVKCLNKEGEPPFNSVDYIRDYIISLGIPPGKSAEHLQSLILFTSREVLEQINGFPSADKYSDAVGTEIAISKKIEAQGYKIAMVSDKRFTYVGHLQWSVEWYKKWIRFKLLVRPYKARMESWLSRLTEQRD